MARLRMKENDLMTEYHGEFDCLVGKQSPELSIEIAVRVARRLPNIFVPIDFSIEEFDKNQTAENKVKEENLVTIRFIFNPLFDGEYHSADGIDFDKVGDTQRFPYNKAKKLLEKFPEAFEVVTDDVTLFQEEAEDTKTEDNKDSVAIAQETVEETNEEDPTLQQQILEILKEAPHSFDELEKKIDIPFNQLRGSVISLSKNKQIVKDDDDKWAIVK